jgi:hypothetical protein
MAKSAMTIVAGILGVVIMATASGKSTQPMKRVVSVVEETGVKRLIIKQDGM